MAEFIGANPRHEMPIIAQSIVFLCLFFSMGTFNSFLSGGKDAGFDYAQLIVFGCYFAAWCIMVVNAARYFPSRRIDAHPLLFYLCFCVVSLLWSGLKSIVIYQTGLYVVAAGFGYFMARRFSLDRITRLLFLVFAVAVAVSVLMVVAVPQVGVHQEYWLLGCWKGIMGHKNHLGRVCAFLFNLSLIRLRKERLQSLIGIAAAVVVCLFTDSKTALIVILYTFIMYYLLRNFSIRTALAANLGLILAGLILPMFTSEVFDMLGRDVTLTGRTYVWEACYRAFWDNPFFGKGFRTFWSKEYGYLSPLFYSEKWMMNDSHNGYFDIILDLGLVGIVLFILCCYSTFKNAIVLEKRESGWIISILLLQSLAKNFTDSTLTKTTNIDWILFCYVYFVSRFAVRSERLRSFQAVGHDPDPALPLRNVTEVGQAGVGGAETVESCE